MTYRKQVLTKAWSFWVTVRVLPPYSGRSYICYPPELKDRDTVKRLWCLKNYRKGSTNSKNKGTNCAQMTSALRTIGRMIRSLSCRLKGDSPSEPKNSDFGEHHRKLNRILEVCLNKYILIFALRLREPCARHPFDDGQFQLEKNSLLASTDLTFYKKNDD